MLVELVKDGKLYRAECHVHDGYILIYGERGSSQVDINGFSISQAAEHALWNLARKGEIDPVD